MRVKFGTGTKDVGILEVNAANYIVPRGEEGSYHCRIEQKNFNASTGERVSKPRIQKFDAKQWPMLSRNLKLQGWSVDVLYDPTAYLKAKEREAQLTREQIAKAKAEAEARRKAEERAALKAEIMAELKAEGVIPSKTKEPKAGGSKK